MRVPPQIARSPLCLVTKCSYASNQNVCLRVGTSLSLISAPTLRLNQHYRVRQNKICVGRDLLQRLNLLDKICVGRDLLQRLNLLELDGGSREEK